MKIYIYKNAALGSCTYNYKKLNINKLVYFSVFKKKAHRYTSKFYTKWGSVTFSAFTKMKK